MGSAKKQGNSAARRARAEEMRRAEQARERRNRIVAIVASVVVVGGMVGGGWAIIASASGDDDPQSSPTSTAKPKVQVTGEKTWGGLARDHVKDSVDYPMKPPVGGKHDARWQNCDAIVYDKPLRNENAVHGLEHGAVWITYNDKAADADVKALSSKVEKTPYTYMSPYPDQPGPIMLTAWGHQLTVENSKDKRIQQFLDTYVQGEQTPEPGAACTGGKPTP
ncbi:hypothetical protein AQ490_00775 [Wenjunlia vitaminophila]|uniref:DUF3105 domain-containing protein n=1 Tax=Wenjunlia vitaminophila TaxID=76728 RepID=A0A0T6LZC1_WENVI|nr:DUF3105 domain-containing protein [Wenjunlia vitaminophila]KRV51334.1 hypothetical protein AQ490_00775 [Wenjunlia vitaminophila]